VIAKNRTVLDFFREIAAIPHCSYQADGLKDWLIKTSEELGYEAKTDAAGNVMACSRQWLVVGQKLFSGCG